MNIFFAFFRLEWKRNFTKRRGIVLVLLLILSIYFLQTGLTAHKAQAEKIEKFKSNYWEYFNNLPSYGVYSVYGIEVLFARANLSFLFQDSSIADTLVSKFDNTFTLRIFKESKTVPLTPGSLFSGLDISGILSIFATFAALAYGVRTIDRRAYTRLLSTIVSRRRMFLSLIPARICIIGLGILFLFLLVLFMMKVNGVPVPAGGYAVAAGYMWAAFLMLVFFYLTGVGIGLLRDMAPSGWLSFGTWFLFLVIIPGIIVQQTDKHAPGVLKSYQGEQEKFRIVTNFESDSMKKHGPFKREKIEIFRSEAKRFLDKDFKQVKEVEGGLWGKMSSYLENYARWLAITPVSFFHLTGNEVSGCGFRSFLDFYDYSSQLQEKFAHFYIRQCFYGDPAKIVSFIENDENIYYGTSRLPGNFWYGVSVSLAWILLFGIIDFFLFNAYLHRVESKEKLQAYNHPIILSKKEFSVYRVSKGKGVGEKLFNLLSGRMRGSETLKLEIAGVDLTENRERVDFVSICHPDELPAYIKAGDFVKFVARLLRLSKESKKTIYDSVKRSGIKGRYMGELSGLEKGTVFSLILPYIKREIYVVDNACLDMPMEFLTDLNDVMLGWSEEGSTVLYLTTEREIEFEQWKPDIRSRDFVKQAMWSEKVSHLKTLGIAGERGQASSDYLPY